MQAADLRIVGDAELAGPSRDMMGFFRQIDRNENVLIFTHTMCLLKI
ncbi:MAG: hypothetical protein ACI9HA_003484 [Dinoroseobacter sp.]|jgi:hypothetical protein